jgi:hypothetical protein
MACYFLSALIAIATFVYLGHLFGAGWPERMKPFDYLMVSLAPGYFIVSAIGVLIWTSRVHLIRVAAIVHGMLIFFMVPLALYTLSRQESQGIGFLGFMLLLYLLLFGPWLLAWYFILFPRKKIAPP